MTARSLLRSGSARRPSKRLLMRNSFHRRAAVPHFRLRDDRLDGLKGVLIILVVIGHVSLGPAMMTSRRTRWPATPTAAARSSSAFALFSVSVARHRHGNAGALPPGKLARDGCVELVVPLAFWVCWPVLLYFFNSYVINRQRPPLIAFVTGPVWNWMRGQLPEHWCPPTGTD